MKLAASKLLYKNVLQFCLYNARRNGSDGGSIRDAGGKWAEMEVAHEEQYFHRQNREMLEYIKQELKKGRTIDDIIEETKKERERKEREKLGLEEEEGDEKQK